MTTRPHVVLFGLGRMGLPIATRLLSAGFDVSGCDPDPHALDAIQAAGGRPVLASNAVATIASAEAAAQSVAHAVVTCVTNEDALLELWLGEAGLQQALNPGLLVIDHTSTSIALAKRLAEHCALASALWVDAPLSGGQTGAQKGALSAMLGGKPLAAQAAQALLRSYCTTITHLGAAGAGQAGKLANQLAIAGTNLGLHMATDFARSQGLGLEAWFNGLAAGSANSVQLSQHRQQLCSQEHGDTQLGAPLFSWLQTDLAMAQAVSDFDNISNIKRLAELLRDVDGT